MKTHIRIILALIMVLSLLSGSTAATVQAQSVTVTTTALSKLRAQPALTAAVLDNVPINTTLKPNAISFDSRWLRVVFKGKTGWIGTRFMRRTEGDYTTLPKVGFNSNTTAPVIEFAVKPATPANASDAVFPGGCVEISWTVANIDKVFYSTDGATYRTALGKETLAAEGEQCLSQTTTFFLKVLTRDGKTIIVPKTIRVVTG